MKKYQFLWTFVAVLGLTSCLDFDDPIDTLTINQEALEDSVYHGNPAKIDYNINITEAQFDDALAALRSYWDGLLSRFRVKSSD